MSAECRSQVVDFITAKAPAGDWYDGVRVPRDPDTERAERQWYADLFAAGYMGGSWPAENGGVVGHTAQHDAIVMEEIVRARVPRPIDQVMLAAHLLITFGTAAQKDRYLPRIRSAEDIWCQLLSEPGVGSDLARLTTKATRQPDGTFRVDGQKVWTTDGQWYQMGVLLARTDPSAAKPHAGLTMFVVDMTTSGIDVRPIREMTGSDEFCEVYFEAAILPAGPAIADPVVRVDLADLQARVAAVQLARCEAIQDVIAAYAPRLDADDIEGCLALFTPDSEYLVFGKTPVGPERVRKMFTRAPRGIHLTGASLIDIAGDTATARTQVLFVDAATQHMRAALYDDELVKQGDAWLFHRRRCQFLTTAGLSDVPQEQLQ